MPLNNYMEVGAIASQLLINNWPGVRRRRGSDRRMGFSIKRAEYPLQGRVNIENKVLKLYLVQRSSDLFLCNTKSNNT